MQTQKMSLANIKGKLSRAEMKNIMAGKLAPGGGCTGTSKCCIGATCTECYPDSTIECSAAATKYTCC